MKNINIIKAVLLLFTVSLFVACDEGGDPDPGATAVVDMAGDWTVVASKNGVPTYNIHLSTYNTAANLPTEMWLDDHDAAYGLKAKVNVDLANLTFSATDADELYYEVTVTVSDGIITKNGATAPSGTIVDTITFTAVFSDSPNNVWTYSGHKRTGFPEDE